MIPALLLLAQAAFFDPAVHEASRQPAFDEFRVVPVRVVLLRSKTVEALDTRLKEADVRRIFEKANRIWNRAGVALAVDAVAEQEAAPPEGFSPERLEDYRALRPAPAERARIVVHYVRRLPTNGVFFGPDAIFVKDEAALRPAKGGVDEPLPRVSSHEIGHAFGLVHRQDVVNLMASGTTGWSLNDEEIGQARAWVAGRDWTWTPAQALEKGHAALVASLPGESPVKDRAKAAR